MKDDCIFCKIANKEMAGSILYEDEEILVILDAYPNVEGHTLVIPKKHYEDIYEVPDEILSKMHKIGKDIAKDLMRNLDKKSLTFLINYGEAQVVKHLHLHLMPEFGKCEMKLSKEEVFAILK